MSEQFLNLLMSLLDERLDDFLVAVWLS